jgi:hypothetical protein
MMRKGNMMYTVEKMNGVWFVMQDSVQVINAHARKRDAVDEVDFLNTHTTKTVKSLMSGKDVEIALNTPLCCDPSSETYWSM